MQPTTPCARLIEAAAHGDCANHGLETLHKAIAEEPSESAKQRMPLSNASPR